MKKALITILSLFFLSFATMGASCQGTWLQQSTTTLNNISTAAGIAIVVIENLGEQCTALLVACQVGDSDGSVPVSEARDKACKALDICAKNYNMVVGKFNELRDLLKKASAALAVANEPLSLEFLQKAQEVFKQLLTIIKPFLQGTSLENIVEVLDGTAPAK